MAQDGGDLGGHLALDAVHVAEPVSQRGQSIDRNQDLDGTRLDLHQTPLVSRCLTAEPGGVSADWQSGPGQLGRCSHGDFPRVLEGK